VKGGEGGERGEGASFWMGGGGGEGDLLNFWLQVMGESFIKAGGGKASLLKDLGGGGGHIIFTITARGFSSPGGRIRLKVLEKGNGQGVVSGRKKGGRLLIC